MNKFTLCMVFFGFLISSQAKSMSSTEESTHASTVISLLQSEDKSSASKKLRDEEEAEKLNSSKNGNQPSLSNPASSKPE